MQDHILEDELLERAIDAVARETGFRFKIDQLEARLGNRELDAVLCAEGTGERLATKVKRWAQHANLGAVINQVTNLPLKGILVADYVNPNMAAKLREMNVQFIDAAGNAYINLPPVYVFVTGNRKPAIDTATKDGGNRAFDRTGLKVVFAFLCRPDLINATYREIASIAGVALGTVGWVLNGLKAAGFVFEKGRGTKRQLADYDRLLDRWVEAYPEKLRPKIFVGTYLAENPNWWQEFEIQTLHGYWGGEVAAARYTNYLKPAVATVYLPKGAETKLVAKARLRKVPQREVGVPNNVWVYQTFWRDDTLPFLDIAEPGLVPPLLVYADLVATGDPRNLEVARMIHAERIDRHSGQD